MRPHIVLVLVALSASLAMSASQAPRQASAAPQAPARDVAGANEAVVGTAAIRGRVVQADSGQPLRGARIGSTGGGIPDRWTDRDGRFEVSGIAAGRYTLTVSRGAYMSLRRSIELTNGQRLDLTDFALTKGGVVAGRVIDERGNDVTGATVALLQWRWDTGLRSPRYLSASGDYMKDQTDDLGQFRLFGIPPGTYVLAIDTEDPFGPGRLTSYYPGYSPSDAATITVEAGREVSGLTVTLARRPRASISGVVRPTGVLPPGAQFMFVRATLAEASQVYFANLSAIVRTDGSYMFTSVPSGEYVLSAENAFGGEPWFAKTRVAVDGADVVVPLTMRPADTLRGRYVFDTGAPPPDLRPPTGPSSGFFAPLDLNLTLIAAGNWTTKSDWTFEAQGLNGRYRLLARAPAGWSVKSVRLGDVDVTDTPLEFNGSDIEGVEILLTQRMTHLTAAVVGRNGATATDARVVVFPEDETKLYPGTRFLGRAVRRRPDASTRAPLNGPFTVDGLPPGRYLAAAVEDLDLGEETNPEVLQRLRPVATSITLREGESATMTLQVVSLR